MFFSSNRTSIDSNLKLPVNITTRESLFVKAMMFFLPVSGLLLLAAKYDLLEMNMGLSFLVLIFLFAIYYLLITVTTAKDTIVLTDKGIELKRVACMPSTKIPLVPWEAINNVALVRNEARICGIAIELKDYKLVEMYKANPAISIYGKKIVNDDEKGINNSCYFDVYIPEFIFSTDTNDLVQFIRGKIGRVERLQRKVSPQAAARRRQVSDFMIMGLFLVLGFIVFSLLEMF